VEISINEKIEVKKINSRPKDILNFIEYFNYNLRISFLWYN